MSENPTSGRESRLAWLKRRVPQFLKGRSKPTEPVEDMQTHIVGDYEVLSDYEARLADATIIKEGLRERTESYQLLQMGGFAPVLYPSEPRAMTFKPDIDPLTPFESRVLDQIHAVLDYKAARNDSTPAIVLDVGCMFGQSLLRMAKDARELVEAKKVVFIGTNLAFNPKQVFQNGNWEHQATGVFGTNMKLMYGEQALWVKNKNFVEYLKGDTSELLDVVGKLPDGKPFPLKGHVDILHTRAAMTHTLIPETDIPKLGEILSDSGVLFLAYGPGGAGDEYKTIKDARRLGRENLLKTGVKQIEEDKNPSYQIYVKPHAPTSVLLPR